MRALAIVVFTGIAVAELHSTAARADGLQDEIYTHPLDGFTAHTLHAGEVLYAQPLSPLPGWAELGVTDTVTAELDVTALLGGFFVAPHLPVPSFNVRWQFVPNVAIEAMTQYLWNPYDQESFPHLLVRRDGLGGFLHLNASLPIAAHAWLHLSAGASYQSSFDVRNVDRVVAHGHTFRDHLDPDASISLDDRWKRWLSLHATVSYGSTFVYSDNEPRKWQVGYGFRIAPFLESRHGFLRALRVEVAALIIDRPDARETLALYVPLLPYAYWQWRI